MDYMVLIASFGGGIMGAYMGALPAFIMTGIIALAASIAIAAGGTTDIAIGFIAFGSMFGPHIAFAGGVAAAAYAGKKKLLGSGSDVLSALNGLNRPDVLIVGGIFGVVGYLISYLISMTPIATLTDLPGITVVASAVVARLMFGSTGITGKYTGSEKRTYISTGNTMGSNIVLGLGIGTAVSFVAASLAQNGLDGALGIFPVICFGISAFTLIFTQTGFAVPATHHISLPSSLAAIVGIQAFGPMGALLGVAFGIITSLVGDLVGNIFNSHCDTHIDPPAMTIFTITIIINLIKIALIGA